MKLLETQCGNTARARQTLEVCMYIVSKKVDDAVSAEMKAWGNILYRNARKNAITRNIPFELTLADFYNLVYRAEGGCMISGVTFNLEKRGAGRRRPFAPSIDRIDSSKGYSARNCRLVCVLVNMALNEWGLDPLLIVAKNIVVREEELKHRQRSRGYWNSLGFDTVADYLKDKGIEDKVISRRVGSAADRYCCENSIQSAWVQRPKLVRKDGSVSYQRVAAYPKTVLDTALEQVQKRLLEIASDAGNGTGNGIWDEAA